MEVLKAVLQARFPTRTAGHWVVMTATISGVNIFAMAYAWSNKGISFIVSTCGTTIRHKKNYMSKFEDAYGNASVKELARPAIAHFLFEFLPLIDEHNKQRQSVLALELSWPTKNCWFRLNTSFIGQSVVDIQRWDRSMCESFNETASKVVEDINIKQMANLLGKPLRTSTLKYQKGTRKSARSHDHGGDNRPDLVQIRGDDGTISYPPRKKGAYGKPRQRTCFICRRYREKNQNTQWMCGKCGMPLCMKDRTSNEKGHERKQSCLHEHKHSDNIYLGCGFISRSPSQFVMPTELILYPIVRANEGF